MKVSNTKCRWVSGSVVSRILEKTVKLKNGCLQYTGSCSSHGYGQISIGRKTLHAHRVIYQNLISPIDDSLVIDHLCRNRLCVNVEHLEIVTCQVNLLRSPITMAGINARKTHCLKGHKFDYVDSQGKRVCRTCKREWYARNGYRKDDYNIVDISNIEFID
jgi:HNH endonuclease